MLLQKRSIWGGVVETYPCCTWFIKTWKPNGPRPLFWSTSLLRHTHVSTRSLRDSGFGCRIRLQTVKIPFSHTTQPGRNRSERFKSGPHGLLLRAPVLKGRLQGNPNKTTYLGGGGPEPRLGPPVERLEYGYPFSVVCFSRGTLPKNSIKGHYWT